MVGCHPKPKLVDPPIIKGPAYAYREALPNTFMVYAANDHAFAEAKAKIGCGVCTIQPAGTYYIIQRYPKQK